MPPLYEWERFCLTKCQRGEKGEERDHSAGAVSTSQVKRKRREEKGKGNARQFG
jgi:hypothetical protein